MKGRKGIYAYGHVHNKTFVVQYVGRSDEDLNNRIRYGIGNKKCLSLTTS